MYQNYDPAGPPPLGHVNQIIPQSRKERHAAQHREDMEKMRLRQRRENFQHYEEGGLVPPPDSLGYLPENQRFTGDSGGILKQERDANVAKREQMYHNKRMIRANLEQDRWEYINMRHDIEQQKMQMQRDNQSHARSNKTSMPYNPVNLSYDNDADGDRLRASDQARKAKAELRTQYLADKASRCQYDIVNHRDRVQGPFG